MKAASYSVLFVFITSSALCMLIENSQATGLENLAKRAEQNHITALANKIHDINPNAPARMIIFAVRDYCPELPETLVLAVIWQESTFRVNAIGKAKEQGLMQIHPMNGRAKSVESNIKTGCELLSSHYEKYRDYKKALRAYNGWGSKGFYSSAVLRKRQLLEKLS